MQTQQRLGRIAKVALLASLAPNSKKFQGIGLRVSDTVPVARQQLVQYLNIGCYLRTHNKRNNDSRGNVASIKAQLVRCIHQAAAGGHCAAQP